MKTHRLKPPKAKPPQTHALKLQRMPDPLPYAPLSPEYAAKDPDPALFTCFCGTRMMREQRGTITRCSRCRRTWQPT